MGEFIEPLGKGMRLLKLIVCILLMTAASCGRKNKGKKRGKKGGGGGGGHQGGNECSIQYYKVSETQYQTFCSNAYKTDCSTSYSSVCTNNPVRQVTNQCSQTTFNRPVSICKNEVVEARDCNVHGGSVQRDRCYIGIGQKECRQSPQTSCNQVPVKSCSKKPVSVQKRVARRVC